MDTGKAFGLPHILSEEIYAKRLQSLREKLLEKNLDGIFLIDQSSLYYMFGFDQIGYWVFQAVWVPTDVNLPVRGICRAPDRILMSRGIGIDEVHVWLDDDSKSPVETMFDWAGSEKASVAAVEFDTHALRADYAKEFLELSASRKISLSGGDDIVTKMREVKGSEEIEFMTKAGFALNQAFIDIEAEIKPGILETELSNLAISAMLREGCDPAAVSPCISAGERTLFQTHLSAKPLPVQNEDIVTVELGAPFNRYHAVGYKTYFMPGAKAEYRAQYEDLREAIHLGLENMKPGTDAADIAGIIHGHLEKTGNSRKGRHVGYSTGIGFPPTWLESLRIKSSQSYSLQAGMTFFLFAGAPTADGTAHMGYGLPVAITDSGFAVLSESFKI